MLVAIEHSLYLRAVARDAAIVREAAGGEVDLLGNGRRPGENGVAVRMTSEGIDDLARQAGLILGNAECSFKCVGAASSKSAWSAMMLDIRAAWSGPSQWPTAIRQKVFSQTFGSASK